MADLVDRIRETIGKAERNEIPASDFDKIFKEFEVAAAQESAPLLAAGQKNHANNLKALLEGLATLNPNHFEESLVSKAENLE